MIDIGTGHSGRRWLATAVAMAVAMAAALGLPALAAADHVQLKSGDFLVGDVVDQTGDAVIVEHPVLGRLEIPAAEVVSVTFDGAETGAEAGDGPPADVVVEEPPAVAPEPKEWKFSVNVAGDGSWGNSDEQSFRVGFTGKRKRPDTRLALDAAYYGGLTDGDTSDNNFTAGTGSVHDWLMPDSRWFWYAAGQYDYDQFESWDHRVSGQFGPGYQLIDREDFTLDLRAGVGPRREWGSDDDSWRFEGSFGFNFTRQLSERQSLEGSSFIYWAFDDPDNYRTRSSLSYALKLDPELNLSFLAGIRHEYQNLVDPGDDRNSTNAFVGLQVDF